MNYQVVLERIISRGCHRKKVQGDGLHRHRIIPGFQEGKYETTNISHLTRKEHYLVHKLRYVLYGQIEDRLAYVRLSCKNLPQEIIQELARLGGLSHKGKPGKPHTEETKKKIGKANSGRKQTAESNLARSRTLKNRVFTEEHRAKLSAAMKGNANWKTNAAFKANVTNDNT